MLEYITKKRTTSPVELTFQSVGDYPYHWHDCLEIIFVLKGTIKIFAGTDNIVLKTGDIEIINFNEIHRIVGKTGNIVLSLKIQAEFAQGIISDIKDIVFNSMVVSYHEKKRDVIGILGKMIGEFALSVDGNIDIIDSNVKADINEILLYLTNNFDIVIHTLKSKVVSSDERKILLSRYRRITNYIYTNFSDKIGLREIAEKENLSLYFLSHEIKNLFGDGFQELLNFRRIHRSMKLLLDSNMNLTEIAYECGYSAPRYFSQYFRKILGTTPLKFRKQFRQTLEQKNSQKWKNDMHRCKKRGRCLQGSGKGRTTDKEVHKVIVGQDDTIEKLLLSLLSGGHSLLVGVPGLAKTLLIKTVADVLDLGFSRIQFTPDLMPSDITGTELIEDDLSTGKKAFKFVKGPVFANIVLADEINRTSPKTQAALLQAMQEHEVTAAGETYNLEEPFFVLATQNPIEQEGTYPLPEAQLDRFMFNLWVDYPSSEEESQIVKSTTSAYDPELKVVLDKAEIIKMQDLVRRVPVADNVVDFAVKLVSLTRPVDKKAPKFIRDWISWGAGPRASQYLILGAKTRAVLEGRATPDIEDVKFMATPVLRHRLVTNFNAEADGVNTVEIIERLIKEMKA